MAEAAISAVRAPSFSTRMSAEKSLVPSGVMRLTMWTASTVPGMGSEVFVNEGDTVEPGTPLFVIDSDAARTAVDKACTTSVSTSVSSPPFFADRNFQTPRPMAMRIRRKINRRTIFLFRIAGNPSSPSSV